MTNPNEILLNKCLNSYPHSLNVNKVIAFCKIGKKIYWATSNPERTRINKKDYLSDHAEHNLCRLIEREHFKGNIKGFERRYYNSKI